MAEVKPAETTPQAQGQTPGAESELQRVREIILGDKAVRPQSPEVDRLRDILFGPQMEEYERRFADLRRELERLVSDIRALQDRLSETERAQAKRMDNLEAELRRATDELKRDINRLNARETLLNQAVSRLQQVEGTEQSHTQAITELRDTLALHERDLRALKSEASQYREQIERKIETVKREMRQAEDDLRSELRRVATRLSDQKTDRKALATMLMEIATRLETGSSVTSLLEDLTGKLKE